MTEPFYNSKQGRSANEPKMHPLIKRSFVFVPTAGMRLAPEVLLLEIMREVFFKRHFGAKAASRPLNPNVAKDEVGELWTDGESAVLYAMCGRRKKNVAAREAEYYAPAYPSLAADGWLGKKRERVVESFLFGGAVAQDLWGECGPSDAAIQQQRELAGAVVRALLGRHSGIVQGGGCVELLAAAISSNVAVGDTDAAIDRICVMTGMSAGTARLGMRDELAGRITADLRALCELEAQIPRAQWLHLFMSFLRFAIPMWMLAQMRITGMLHRWLIDAVDFNKVVGPEEIIASIARRNRGMLRPTLTGTRELHDHIERYMKSRVELNILLYTLQGAMEGDALAKELTCGRAGSGQITVCELLSLARAAAPLMRKLPRYRKIAANEPAQTFMTREAEVFQAWRSPLSHGQGKNLAELLLVLHRAEKGDEAGGYLFTPEGRGASRGFRTFPGQLLLKSVTCLAAARKNDAARTGGAGKLVLQDVEDVFSEYGVDFAAAADARPLLMQELEALGLLAGSPDAGSSVAVAYPF
jgi:hypothetical protein